MHFPDRLVAIPLDTSDHGRRIGSQPTIDGVSGIVVIVANADTDFLVGGVIVEHRELALLVDRKGGEIKALPIGPGLLDIPHVPLADMRCVVTLAGQYFRQGDFLAGEPEA